MFNVSWCLRGYLNPFTFPFVYFSHAFSISTSFILASVHSHAKMSANSSSFCFLVCFFICKGCSQFADLFNEPHKGFRRSALPVPLLIPFGYQLLKILYCHFLPKRSRVIMDSVRQHFRKFCRAEDFPDAFCCLSADFFHLQAEWFIVCLLSKLQMAEQWAVDSLDDFEQ